ncbi:hypothetical protein BDZ89DRAFT_117705 [Hymenopellis radicata]|nr:hypothetical protein BDZ89DRAFT_117705 [Hymenopellis radicata]
MLPEYWETLVPNTASSVQDLMIAPVIYANVHRRSLAWHLAGHKRLRSFFIVLFDVLPETLLPDNLENLKILVYMRGQAWSELDAHLDTFPFISSVEILLLESYPPLSNFVGFCSSTWDSEGTDEWQEEVIRGMPLLSNRGILNVKQFTDIDG